MFNSMLDQTSHIMIHTGTAGIAANEVLAATKVWFTHPEFDPRAPVIWDIREAFLDMSIEEMRQMYTLVRETVDSKRAGGKTAWVHSSRLVRAMITVVSDEFDWGSEWKTFQDLNDAREWCLETP